jgi:hypothetical protein
MTFFKDFQAPVMATCANQQHSQVISEYGKRIIRISDHQVVKWGPDMTKEENEPQEWRMSSWTAV